MCDQPTVCTYHVCSIPCARQRPLHAIRVTRGWSVWSRVRRWRHRRVLAESGPTGARNACVTGLRRAHPHFTALHTHGNGHYTRSGTHGRELCGVRPRLAPPPGARGIRPHRHMQRVCDRATACTPPFCSTQCALQRSKPAVGVTRRRSVRPSSIPCHHDGF